VQRGVLGSKGFSGTKYVWFDEALTAKLDRVERSGFSGIWIHKIETKYKMGLLASGAVLGMSQI
jgi:hypothetical protein